MDDETTGRLPEDDEELTRVTPPDDATRVMPPAATTRPRASCPAPTRPAATRVMPAAGGTPPAAAHPAHPPHVARPPALDDGGGVPWWVWLLVVLAIVAAAAALWYFYLRPTHPVDDRRRGVHRQLGAARTGTGGGLVIKQDGDQFKVTQYDPQLQQAGSTTADPRGRRSSTLTVKASAIGLTDVTGTIQGTLTHDAGERHADAAVLGREPAAQADRATCASTCSCPARRAPRRPRRATPSPSPTTVAVADDHRQPHHLRRRRTSDQQAQDNIAKLQVGIVAWAADNNNLYPPPQDVVRGRRPLAVREPLADQPVHRPAHGARHLARQLRVRAAERRPGATSSPATSATASPTRCRDADRRTPAAV